MKRGDIFRCDDHESYFICLTSSELTCSGVSVMFVGDDKYVNTEAAYSIDFINREFEKVYSPCEQPTSDISNSENAVDHPSHYESGKFECIDVMEEAIGEEDVRGFCLCNAFKYIYRCKHKHESPVEDIKKAVWYLSKYLELVAERGGNT